MSELYDQDILREEYDKFIEAEYQAWQDKQIEVARVQIADAIKTALAIGFDRESIELEVEFALDKIEEE